MTPETRVITDRPIAANQAQQGTCWAEFSLRYDKITLSFFLMQDTLHQDTYLNYIPKWA